MSSPAIRIHPADNVVIARRQLLGGTVIAERRRHRRRPGAAGPQGRHARHRRGRAGAALQPDHRHRHAGHRGRPARAHAQPGLQRLRARRTSRAPVPHPRRYVAEPATFDGIVRADGRVATRNYIGVLTSVNCSATAARAIADHFRRDIRPEALADYPNVDGVVALTHGMGCATDSDGEELQVLRRTLGGYARHPNFAAVLVVGLGCETNQIQGLIAQEGLQEGAQLVTFNIQDTGGTAKTVARGIEVIQRAAAAMPTACTRQPVPAQPPHGRPAVRRQRRLFRHQRQPGAGRGGRPPGAPRRHRHPERNARDLRRRTPADAPRRQPRSGRQAARAHRLVGAVHRAQRHADGQQPLGRQQGRRADDDPGKEPGRDRQERHHQPGRRATSLPSASSAQGFVYMDTPGYDPVSATGQVAGGANLICFTTGRGSAYGCAPSPSLKFSTNTALWLKQQDDIDLDCGGIVEGAGNGGRSRRAHLPVDAGHGLGPPHQERVARLRAERVRALATGCGDVGSGSEPMPPDPARLIDDHSEPA